EMVKAILSKLHKESLLTIFERSRPRLYRLMDPETFISIASGKINRLKIPQERYLKLIYDCCKALRENIDLTSLAVYGSVARGTAGDTSDVDLFTVSNDFKGTLGERIEFLTRIVEKRVGDEIRFLQDNKIYTFLSFYPLRKFEAEKLPLIMLDMVDDSKIVYDEDGFLENLLLKLKLKLIDAKVRKVYIEKNKWYWDLHPDFGYVKAIPYG
ncbi:nucleotidyltransferase domain-containing protein, partial [Candidatus Bathyarchaeota archaeon]|nr:nucleotidyltransferase domain-containing protein [Candidatus Bathyarchaeota archaeon]